jgi:beta-glucosidase
VGYRHYDTVGQKPLFRFGHGLSYTSFRLSDLGLQETGTNAGNIKDEFIRVTVSVSNTGSLSGAEVVQVYVCPPQTSTVGRPVRELRGFAKVFLEPGETRDVEVVVPLGLATSFWDEARSAWCSEKGTYTFEVVGTGEANVLSAPFEVRVSRFWNGL